jgi:TolA-binding protein
MIQPLASNRSVWLLYWLELSEVVPGPKGSMLPTIVILGDSSGIPLAPPDLGHELDQGKAERLIQNALERQSAPETLIIGQSEDWDREAWLDFGKEYKIAIEFQQLDQKGVVQLVQVAKTLSERSEEPASPPTPEKIVTELMANSKDLRSPRRKRAYLGKILEMDPSHAEARVELADLDMSESEWKSAAIHYREAERKISSESQKAELLWEEPLGKIYLRSLYGSGMCHWHSGAYEDAASSFLEIMERNPKDHQGTRFFVPMLLLLSEQFHRAAEYYETYARKYPKDFVEPAFTFGWGLTEHHRGEESEAKHKYQAAMLKNLYIAPLLLDEELPSTQIWQPTDRAEIQYAEEFLDSYAVLWDREPSALRLVREAWQGLEPRIRELIQLRRKIQEFQDQRYDPDYKKHWKRLVEQDDAMSSIPQSLSNN